MTTMENPMAMMVKDAMGDAIREIVRDVIREELAPIVDTINDLENSMSRVNVLAVKADKGMADFTEAIEKAKNAGGFVGKLLKSVMDD